MQLTIEITKYSDTEYAASIPDEDNPYGPPLAEAFSVSPRAAVLKLIGAIDLTVEEN